MGKKEGVKEKVNYWYGFGEAFKNSKLDKRFWSCFLLNILAGFFVILVIATFFSVIVSKILDILIDKGNVLDLFLDPLSIMDLLFGEWVFFTIVLVASIFGFLLISSILKSKIWKRSVREEWGFIYLIKFVLLRTLFFFIFLLLSLLGIALVNFHYINSSIVAVVIYLVVLNYFFVSLVFLSKENLFWESLAKGFTKGSKFHKLIPLYLFFIILAGIYAGIVYLLFILLSPLKIPTIAEIISNPSIALTVIYPYSFMIILSLIILVFFRAYIRIFYVEFILADSSKYKKYEKPKISVKLRKPPERKDKAPEKKSKEIKVDRKNVKLMRNKKRERKKTIVKKKKDKKVKADGDKGFLDEAIDKLE